MTDRKAALEALDRIAEDLESLGSLPGSWIVEDIATIRAALSEPAAEPVAWHARRWMDKPVTVVTTRIKSFGGEAPHEHMVERSTMPALRRPASARGGGRTGSAAPLCRASPRPGRNPKDDDRCLR